MHLIVSIALGVFGGLWLFNLSIAWIVNWELRREDKARRKAAEARAAKAQAAQAQAAEAAAAQGVVQAAVAQAAKNIATIARSAMLTAADRKRLISILEMPSNSERDRLERNRLGEALRREYDLPWTDLLAPEPPAAAIRNCVTA